MDQKIMHIDELLSITLGLLWYDWHYYKPPALVTFNLSDTRYVFTDGQIHLPYLCCQFILSQASSKFLWVCISKTLFLSLQQ